MRRVISLLICLCLSLTAVALSGCEGCQNLVYKTAIEKALHEDALTGTEPTTSHTNAMRNVDLTNCPPDFREAYMKHIHAWEEEAAVHQAKVQVDSQEDTAAAAGVLASLFDSDATPWKDHEEAEQEVDRLAKIASGDVRSTWEGVEDVASKYGAQVPH